MKEKSVRDKESRDLEMNKLSVEDVKARNEELARMKTLLFYQEQKNKRIKSKKYHKIRKRAEERREEKMREILKQTDPERYKELLEKDAVKRAKERMSLKHKNTSKVGAARAAEAQGAERRARGVLDRVVRADAEQVSDGRASDGQSGRDAERVAGPLLAAAHRLLL